MLTIAALTMDRSNLSDRSSIETACLPSGVISDGRHCCNIGRPAVPRIARTWIFECVYASRFDRICFRSPRGGGEDGGCALRRERATSAAPRRAAQVAVRVSGRGPHSAVQRHRQPRRVCGRRRGCRCAPCSPGGSTARGDIWATEGPLCRWLCLMRSVLRWKQPVLCAVFSIRWTGTPSSAKTITQPSGP